MQATSDGSNFIWRSRWGQFCILVLAVVMAALLPVPFGLQTARAQAPRPIAPLAPTAHPGAHAYLLRGFMNIFSLGMDDLAANIRRVGIKTSVYNYADAEGGGARSQRRHHLDRKLDR